MTTVTCVGALLLVLGFAAWQVRTRTSWTWPAFWLSVTLIALLVPNFRISSPVDARVFALLAALLTFLTRWGAVDQRARLRMELTRLLQPRSRVERVWCWSLVALIAWICVGVIWSPAGPTYLAAQFAFAVGLALCVVSVLDDAHILRRALVLMVVFVGVATAAELVVDPEGVRLAGRLRGPFVDANTLGLVVAFALPALVVTVPRAKWLVVLVGLCVVWETGTRTALLALAVVGVLAVWHGRHSVRTVAARVWGYRSGRLGLGALAVGTCAVAAVAIDRALATGANEASVLRSNNSRTEVWSASQELVDQHPWRGLGIGGYTSDFQTGSSYYASMILLGVIGTVCIALILVTSAKLARCRMDWLGLTLASATVTAIFEGWILAPGGPFCVVFWVALIAWVWRELQTQEPAPTSRVEAGAGRVGHPDRRS